MADNMIKPMSDEFSDYLHDESKKVGHGESISFPRDEVQVRRIIAELNDNGTPVTVQGARTGISGGAVPLGGHIMNLGRMDGATGMSIGENGRYRVRLQPGVVLSELRRFVESKKFVTVGWDEASLEAYTEFCRAGEQFFPPDPTETSATIGGMVSCNASGARSYMYGSVRKHITGLHVVLSNGDMLILNRGERFASGRRLLLETVGQRKIELELPAINMPALKNTAGYYVTDDMDAIDLFIGSDGTLGVITEIEAELMPLPRFIWGVTCLFDSEDNCIRFVQLLHGITGVAAMEFFDGDAIEILRRQRRESPAFASLPCVKEGICGAIYVELHSDDAEAILEKLYEVGSLMEKAGGLEEDTWVARNQSDITRLLFFRHAVPESVNMMIEKVKRDNPSVTKLGTDMAVPQSRLPDAVRMYRAGLRKYGLSSAIWGHIGDSHLHVNILPRDGGQYATGKRLYAEWAAEIVRMGGTVSAEHGIGKLKTEFLLTMYGEKRISEMKLLKKTLDPETILGKGNLF